MVLSSAVAEQHGQYTANKLVKYGFIPLVAAMVMLTVVIRLVPPAPFWTDQDAFAKFLDSKNLVVNVRRSRGKDIDAACGQLANKNAALLKDQVVRKVR